MWHVLVCHGFARNSCARTYAHIHGLDICSVLLSLYNSNNNSFTNTAGNVLLLCTPRRYTQKRFEALRVLVFAVYGLCGDAHTSPCTSATDRTLLSIAFTYSLYNCLRFRTTYDSQTEYGLTKSWCLIVGTAPLIYSLFVDTIPWWKSPLYAGLRTVSHPCWLAHSIQQFRYNRNLQE